jgi:hypothetical protein
VIVMRVGEPGAARDSRQTTVELGPKPVEIIVAHLVNGDENDERGRSGRAAICFDRRLGAGSGRGQNAKERYKGLERVGHGQIIPSDRAMQETMA